MLFEGILRFSAAERNVTANDSITVFEDDGEVLEEVGEAANLQVTTFFVSEGDVAESAGGQSVAVHHRTDAEQTALGRAVADVVVEGELFRDRGVSLLS